jgi:hypothetical protein
MLADLVLLEHMHLRLLVVLLSILLSGTRALVLLKAAVEGHRSGASQHSTQHLLLLLLRGPGCSPEP